MYANILGEISIL